MTHDVSTQIQLAARPTGWPTLEDFRTARIELPPLAPGQVRVANEFISVDPYMRGRMNEGESYVPPFVVGQTMDGGAVGRVIASNSPEVPVGSLAVHMLGWRDVSQGDASMFQIVPELPGVPSSVYLGIFGLTGFTAYIGLTAIAHVQPGDRVFVSGGAGAVGTAVGQFARLLGASQVVGSAGTEAKVNLLTSKYGFDAAINYCLGPVREQLPQVMPEGIDVYFDNVGGEHLEAALDLMRRHGRIAMCGAISGYNASEPEPGPDNLANVITRGLTMQGFTMPDYMQFMPEFTETIGGWFAAGEIVYDETVREGIDQAPAAFLDMLRGANTGKMVVRMSA